jgi:hypothetical protein
MQQQQTTVALVFVWFTVTSKSDFFCLTKRTTLPARFAVHRVVFTSRDGCTV